MKFTGSYYEGFYAGENGAEFLEWESDEWKRGYEDGMNQAFEEDPEAFM